MCQHVSPSSELRLVGGASSSEGRLEIYHDGEWGTVCDDYFNANGGKVACRQLGLPFQYPEATRDFGAGTGTIWLDDVRCGGDEDSLTSCSHRPWGSNDCGHSGDIGLRCQSTYFCSCS